MSSPGEEAPYPGAGSQHALTDDCDGRPDDGHPRQDDRLSSGRDPQSPEEPASHDTAEETENDVPPPAVAATLHDMSHPHSGEHSDEGQHDYRDGIHGVTWRRGS